MIFNKIKIISPNKLIIFSFVFIFILFFQISEIKAAQTCSWLYTKEGLTTYTCDRLDLGTKSENPDTKCASATKPSKCTSAAVQSGDCVCCCKEVAATLNTTMPKITIPDIKLQINIPGLSLTKGADILANCQKDAKGNPIKCTFPWISEYVAGVYKYAIGIVGILAAVVLMIGGVIWIVAGGSATMIGEAKAWIGASLTGLVIALCSYVILYQVNPALVGFKNLEIQFVEKIPDTEPVSSEGNPTNSKDCNNCIALPAGKFKNGSLINANIANKLNSVNSNGVAWIVTEAYPPTSNHQSKCHYNGMCADIGIRPTPPTCAQVNTLINSFQNAGFKVLNEFQNCGGVPTAYATGGHLHISL